MVKEYELNAAIENVAKEMHEFNSNPITWLKWIVFFLDQLEDQSMDVNPYNHEHYAEMIANLQDAIHNRLETGNW